MPHMTFNKVLTQCCVLRTSRLVTVLILFLWTYQFFIKEPEMIQESGFWNWNFDRTRSCQYATLCSNDKLHVYFSGFYKKKVSASICYYLSWHSSLIAKCNYGLVWTNTWVFPTSCIWSSIIMLNIRGFLKIITQLNFYE